MNSMGLRHHLPAATMLSLTGICWLLLSWRRWPDVLIDYGRELYVPWRMAGGASLYHDVAWLYGPLSPRFNALLFDICGPSFTVLFCCNLLVVACFTALIYGTVVQWTGRLVATVCGLTFLSLFAFAHLQEVGNYNFVAPYSHALTHGIFLAWVSLAALWKYVETVRARYLVLHALATGLVFLTKVEVCLALAGALVVGWALLARAPRRLGIKLGRPLAWAVGGVIVTALTWAALHAPGGGFLRGLGDVGFAWGVLLGSPAGATHFHRVVMFGESALRSVVQLLAICLTYAGALGLLVWLTSTRRTPGNRQALISAFVVLAVGTIAIWQWDQRWLWSQLFRPLPVVMALLLLAAVLNFRRRLESRREMARQLALAMFAALALGLLMKILLQVRLDGYGFALAMPATLLTVCAILQWLPAWLRQYTAGGAAVTAACWAGLFAVGAWYTATSVAHYRQKTRPFATGGDTIMVSATSERDRCLIDAVAFINQNLRPADRLAVFPEGVMLNYVTRRPSSIPYYNFDPSVIPVYGESTMTAALAADPPEYVFVCARQTIEFGARRFGVDYARQLSAWIENNYTTLSHIGTWPPQGNHFGLVILRRKPNNTESPDTTANTPALPP